jgi:hypothetical protein
MADNKIRSVYGGQADFIRAKLDGVGPGMCLAKWQQVSINLTAGLTHSCYHPRPHKIPLDELAASPSALHNTTHKKQQRKTMLEGGRPSECQYCWNIEDAPGDHLSDRHYRSGEPWAASTFEQVVSNPWDWDVTPSYVEVNFNQACNFKCSYCSPHLSSTWMQEAERFGPYPTLTPHNSLDHLRRAGLMPIPNRDHNPYVEAFWKWWPELYRSLKHFRMTGGEPLMDKNTYKVFDYIIKNPKPDLQLALTSNFCPDQRLFDKFIEQIDRIDEDDSVEHIMTFVSLDAIAARAEYIRHGMNYDLVMQNVRRYLSTGRRRSISFIITFNNMTVTSLRPLIESLIELRREFNVDKQLVWFDTPMLRSPQWQTLQTLPPRYRDILANDIEYFRQNIETADNRLYAVKDYEIAKLARALEWMKQGDALPADQLLRDRANFYRFFQEHDRRRDTSFLGTFPEMSDFWDLCEAANDDVTAAISNPHR